MICVGFKAFGSDLLGAIATILCGADLLLYRQVKRHGLLVCCEAPSRYTVSP
jgi:hypothetical protein